MKTQTLYEFLRKLANLNVTMVIEGIAHDPGVIAGRVEYPDLDVSPRDLIQTMYDGGIRFFRLENGREVYLMPGQILWHKKKNVKNKKGLYLVKK